MVDLQRRRFVFLTAVVGQQTSIHDYTAKIEQPLLEKRVGVSSPDSGISGAYAYWEREHEQLLKRVKRLEQKLEQLKEKAYVSCPWCEGELSWDAEYQEWSCSCDAGYSIKAEDSKLERLIIRLRVDAEFAAGQIVQICEGGPGYAPKPKNWFQTKYAWAWDKYPSVYVSLERLSLCRRFRSDLACTNCGAGPEEVVMGCSSALCPRCSKKKWEQRTQRIFERLEPYLTIFDTWAIWTFTLPHTLREAVWDWSVLVKLKQKAVEICKNIVGGKVGLAVIHTFSSRDHTKKNPHIHLIVGGRKQSARFDMGRRAWTGGLKYVNVLEAWARTLEKMFGYICRRTKPNSQYSNGIPKVIVQEGKRTKSRKGGPFLKGGESEEIRKGVLWKKIRYELRFAGQHLDNSSVSEGFSEVDLEDGGIFKHYELTLHHKVFTCWGEVVRGARGLPIKDLESISFVGKKLGSLSLTRAQKRAILKHLKQEGKPTCNLSEKLVGSDEETLIKKSAYVVEQRIKERYNLCPDCGEQFALLGICDLENSENSWVKRDMLEMLVGTFPKWIDYAINRENYGNKVV